MKDPVTAFSVESNHAPFQRALRTEKSFYKWYLEPEQISERQTFGIFIKGSTTILLQNLLLGCTSPDLCNRTCADDMPKYLIGEIYQRVLLLLTWAGVLVHPATLFFKAHPELRYVVQDLPAVVEDGRKVIARAPEFEAHALTHLHFSIVHSRNPEALASGQIIFQGKELHEHMDN